MLEADYLFKLDKAITQYLIVSFLTLRVMYRKFCSILFVFSSIHHKNDIFNHKRKGADVSFRSQHFVCRCSSRLFYVHCKSRQMFSIGKVSTRQLCARPLVELSCKRIDIFWTIFTQRQLKKITKKTSITEYLAVSLTSA